MALIKCKECGKEISDKAKTCPNCGCPIEDVISWKEFTQDATSETVSPDDTVVISNQNVNLKDLWNRNQTKVKCVAELRKKYGLDMQQAQRIVDDYMVKRGLKDKPNTNQGCLTLGILFIVFCCWLAFCTDGGTKEEDATTEQVTTEEATTEEVTTEEASTEISLDDFKEQAEEVTYEDIYRNPETYRDKPIKITLYVNEYDTQYLGLMDVYYCKADSKDVFVTDYRETKEPTIASGDTVVVYGRGAGTVTLTEKEKNAIGITTDSEKTLIPSINMKYVELAN